MTNNKEKSLSNGKIKIYASNISMNKKIKELEGILGIKKPTGKKGKTLKIKIKNQKEIKNKLIKKYEKEIKQRNALYKKAVKLSLKLNKPLRVANLEGTRKSVWVKELQSLRMKRLRGKDDYSKKWRKKKERAKIFKPLLKEIINYEKTVIDQQIKNKNFQTILNNVINNEETLTTQQIKKFYNKVINEGKHVLHIVMKNGDEKTIMFNQASKDFIEHILTNGAVIYAKESFESDTITALDIENIAKIIIEKVKKPKNAILNNDGAFFGYINTSLINLKKYQIFNKREADDKKEMAKREQCLIHTLIEAGIKNSIVNQIKLAYIKGASIAKKDLRDIANMIKRNINLMTLTPETFKLRKQKIKSKYGIEGDDLNIALYENHYFLYEPTEYTIYSIRNYDKLHNIDGFKSFTKTVKGKNGNKIYITNKKVKKMYSLQLVNNLHRQNLFKKLDMTMFEETASNVNTREHIYLNNINKEQQKVSAGYSKTYKKEMKIYKLIKEKEEETNLKVKREMEKNINKLIMADAMNNPRPIQYIYYADCETFVNGDHHSLYLIGVTSRENKTDDVNIYNMCDEKEKEGVSREQLTVYKFLNDVTKNKTQNALVYFHNLKYDYHILEKYLNIKGKCIKDGQLYNVICKFGACEIELRDSFKILNFSLSRFTEELELDEKYCKKEAINYTYYTKENNNKIINKEKYKIGMSKENIKIFEDNVKTKLFNPLTYYKDYLKLDCLVLKHGIEKFDKLVNIATNGLSIYDSLTISSITDKFMNFEGCYEGVYEVKGNLRAYIAKAVIGGRVHVNTEYKKDTITGKISDYDGVSLYPSAIKRLCGIMGLPKGKAKRYVKRKTDAKYYRCWGYGFDRRIKYVNGIYYSKGLYSQISPYIKMDDDELKFFEKFKKIMKEECNKTLEDMEEKPFMGFEEWKNNTYSIMTVKINKVNKKQQMPFIAHKTKDGIDYKNTAPAEPVVIDSITLKDYINFHKIEYEILDGVYWNEGGNDEMGTVIEGLFKKRKIEKEKGNEALQGVLKLMLNSAYGKTIMKKSKYKKSIVNTTKNVRNEKTGLWETVPTRNWQNYIYRNFNTIKNYRKLNKNCYEVESICADTGYNRGHIGCAILSSSKNIMNEVFDVANENNYPIYYTDTDSLHCNFEDVEKLEEKFKEKYNRELNGKNLEQFHTDFSMKDENGENRQGKGEEIYATKSIFLGKKSYIDCLESKDENGNIITGFHIRLKGITKEGILHSAKKCNINDNTKPDYFKLYEELAKGEKKEMTLNPVNDEELSEKVLFEFKNGNVGTRATGEFKRIVKF